MRKKYFITTIFVAAFLIFGCTESETTVKKNSIDTVVKLTHRPIVEENNGNIEYDLLDSNIVGYVSRLDSIYTSAPYYFKLDGVYVFYVCEGELKYGKNGEFNSEKALFGIVDQNNKQLLKPIYSKIYNPDATCKGYIEIEGNGKRGLFNYKTGAIIEPQFDVIFPSDQIDIEVFAKKGGSYFTIVNNIVSPYDGKIPMYTSYWQKWKFNIKDAEIKHLMYSYSYVDYAEDPEEAAGVVFTPSYLFDLGFLPEVATGVCESKNERKCFGVIENHGEVIESYSITNKIAAFISSFYEEGVDGRGWEINQNSLVTVDEKNNVLGRQLILERSDFNMLQFCSENCRGYRFLDNNILEVYDVLYNKDKYEEYSRMTVYSYYKIEQNGSIKELKSNRSFDFTKFIKINESHLKGLFYKDKSDSERADGNDDSNMWSSECLSIEDLDIMRNEIYAEYGLIFKTLKWQEYFKKKGWYKPRYENVDAHLSEIDKANLKVILSLRNKMVGNENKYTNKRSFTFSAAG